MDPPDYARIHRPIYMYAVPPPFRIDWCGLSVASPVSLGADCKKLEIEGVLLVPRFCYVPNKPSGDTRSFFLRVQIPI